MLKVIVMIDCNICGQSFDRVVTSCDRHPEAWKFLACDLEYEAERSGWSLQRSAHHCDYCVSDAQISRRQADQHTSQDEELPF
jgi:hypothetical protein